MSNPTLKPEMRVRRVEVLETEIDDQTVMMDIDQGRYFGLNQTGTQIWTLLAQPTVIGDLCDQLTAQFEVPREQCEQELVVYLESLLRRGLLEVVTDESA